MAVRATSLCALLSNDSGRLTQCLSSCDRVTIRLPNCHGKVSHSLFFTVSTDEVDKNIFAVQDIISALPQPILYPYRRSFLATQAILLLRCYDLSRDERDLEASTSQFTRVIFLPFYPRPSAGYSINPLRDFFCLTEALLPRHSYMLPNLLLRLTLTRALQWRRATAFGI